MAGGLLGMVSGSAVANVMAVGPMTFPMMKKDGFSKPLLSPRHKKQQVSLL